MRGRHTYHKLDGSALCRDDVIPALSEVTKLILDCDGVIVSDRDSYREAIMRSVDYYFVRLLGLTGKKERLVTQEDIQRMKDTGAFNNDWKLTYALISYYLGLVLRHLGEDKLGDVPEGLKEFQDTQDLESFLTDLRKFGERADQLGIDIAYLRSMKANPRVGLNQLLEIFHRHIDIQILQGVGHILRLGNQMLETVKTLCPFNVDSEDLLRRLFDELYLGKALYTKFTGKKSLFDFAEGLIDKEEMIISLKTLERLKSRFGLLAIYSERPKNEGLYVLQKCNILHYFDRQTIFFNEDLMRTPDVSDSGTTLGKPDARAFVAFLRTFCKRNGVIAYVGDTVSDALMIRNARIVESMRLIFIGTSSSSPNGKGLQNKFMELGAEVIVRDANLIPAVFDKIGK